MEYYFKWMLSIIRDINLYYVKNLHKNYCHLISCDPKVLAPPFSFQKYSLPFFTKQNALDMHFFPTLNNMCFFSSSTISND
jgi:hypothetical protein